MPQQWRFIDSGCSNAYYNMALDEALLRAVIEGHSSPSVRFYGWEPAAVSIGHTQNVASGVNLAACNRRGLTVVRRPTGGRGVLHEQELTYSVIAPKDCFPEPGLLPSYRAIAKALIQGLADLGIKGDLATPRNGGQNRSGACFLASSRYEVTVKGRKLIGSAQRRVKAHILQQGSILLAVDYETLVDLFPSAGISKPELIQRSRTKITSLAELVDQPLRIEQLKQGIKKGFMQVLGIEFVKAEPTIYERKLAQQLNKQKYSTLAWNFKRGE